MFHAFNNVFYTDLHRIQPYTYTYPSHALIDTALGGDACAASVCGTEARVAYQLRSAQHERALPTHAAIMSGYAP